MMSKESLTQPSEYIRILAVDDDKGMMEFYTELFKLKQPNCFVDQLSNLLFAGKMCTNPKQQPLPILIQLGKAFSGKSGLAAMQKGVRIGKPYSVVLMDIRMPGGWDGVETAVKIRDEFPETKFIFVTAYMQNNIEQLWNKFGINFSYLRKPFDRDEFLQQVLLLGSSWLQEKQAKI